MQPVHQRLLPCAQMRLMHLLHLNETCRAIELVFATGFCQGYRGFLIHTSVWLCCWCQGIGKAGHCSLMIGHGDQQSLQSPSREAARAAAVHAPLSGLPHRSLMQAPPCSHIRHTHTRHTVAGSRFYLVLGCDNSRFLNALHTWRCR